MNPATETLPRFVVSLDFELRWGVHHRLGLDATAYRGELEGERRAVPLLLGVLAERALRATWATVGAVACSGWDDYFARAPRPPRYTDRRLAVDARYAELDPNGRLHFAPELVDRIAATPGQELGTHTFSHLLLREAGVAAADAAGDLAAVARLWSERFGAAPRSLVFPRNQAAFLDVARALDIRVWRGNPSRWYYERNEVEAGPAVRLLRLLDDVVPWTKHSRRLIGDMTTASLFLRLGLPGSAWKLHVAHVRNEIERLGPGEIFHLWWHPHNLGADPERRLDRVREVLDFAAERVARGSLRSASMGDLVS